MKKRERTKKLGLHRETLRNILIDGDLRKAVGQENAPTGRVGGCPTEICPTGTCSIAPYICE